MHYAAARKTATPATRNPPNKARIPARGAPVVGPEIRRRGVEPPFARSPAARPAPQAKNLPSKNLSPKASIARREGGRVLRTALDLAVSPVQRKCAGCGKCPGCAEKERIRRKQVAPHGRIQRKNKAADSAAAKIYDALWGYTSGADSTIILNQFKGKNATQIKAILKALKGVAGEGAFDWMLSDMTEEDGRELRDILLKANTAEMHRTIASEVQDLLDGYTSKADSQEMIQLLMKCPASQLDRVLKKLETANKMTSEQMSAWLFDDLDAVSAERLRSYMFSSGAAYAADAYASPFTAAKIEALIAGYTSRADSRAIVRNFQRTPENERLSVFVDLDDKTRGRWGMSAENALMEDMDQSDYSRFRGFGLPLRPYDYTQSWLEAGLSAGESLVAVLEMGVCGLGGAVTGIASIAWDVVATLWDMTMAVKNLLGSFVYLISRGGAGSKEWLAVKEFFQGLGMLFSQPDEVVAAVWKEIQTEGEMIEGTFETCRKAWYWVHKFVRFFLNLVLVLAAGYGAVKGGLTGIRTASKTLRESGWKGVKDLGKKKLVDRGKGMADDVKNVAQLLKTPRQTLSSARNKVLLIKTMAADEGYWHVMRRTVGARIVAEKEFWKKNREQWAADADSLNTRVETIQGKVDDLGSKPLDQAELEKIESQAKEVDADASLRLSKVLDDDDDIDDMVLEDLEVIDLSPTNEKDSLDDAVEDWAKRFQEQNQVNKEKMDQRKVENTLASGGLPDLGKKMGNGHAIQGRLFYLKPTQDDIYVQTIREYTAMMKIPANRGGWDWDRMKTAKDFIQIGPDGEIMHGHHRVIAATLAKQKIPDDVVKLEKFCNRPQRMWSTIGQRPGRNSVSTSVPVSKGWLELLGLSAFYTSTIARAKDASDDQK